MQMHGHLAPIHRDILDSSSARTAHAIRETAPLSSDCLARYAGPALECKSLHSEALVHLPMLHILHRGGCHVSHFFPRFHTRVANKPCKKACSRSVGEQRPAVSEAREALRGLRLGLRPLHICLLCRVTSVLSCTHAPASVASSLASRT